MVLFNLTSILEDALSTTENVAPEELPIESTSTSTHCILDIPEVKIPFNVPDLINPFVSSKTYSKKNPEYDDGSIVRIVVLVALFIVTVSGAQM